MSIISALRTFIAGYSGLETGALLLVDALGQTPIQYAIIPVPGERTVETYLNNSKLREFPFAFQSANSTADDLERIETSGFFESFADWLDSQSEAGNLPTLGVKKTATAIEATSWAYLYEQSDSQTGIYQILCKLTYEQQP